MFLMNKIRFATDYQSNTTNKPTFIDLPCFIDSFRILSNATKTFFTHLFRAITQFNSYYCANIVVNTNEMIFTLTSTNG